MENAQELKKWAIIEAAKLYKEYYPDEPLNLDQIGKMANFLFKFVSLPYCTIG